ncbi:MAG TPA: alpha/beta fold hydrolase [Acidobacteriaceae bacterium]|jgi:surfactin synthase thioesterase subunit
MTSMFQRAPSRRDPVIRLFCIPNAGNGPSAFRGWAPLLAPEIEATVVELPGRESRFREKPYERMEPLVADLAAAVIDCQGPDQPFAFFGNSLGSVIAFETLHEIRRRTGREALHLFVSAAGAPHCQPPLPPMGHLCDRELVRAVDERYGGIPAQVLADAEFLAAILPTLRADICLLEAYQRRQPVPLSCPVTAFAGLRDATVPLEHVDAWREQTCGEFERFFLDEGHLYLQSAREFLIGCVRENLLAAAPLKQEVMGP